MLVGGKRLQYLVLGGKTGIVLLGDGPDGLLVIEMSHLDVDPQLFTHSQVEMVHD